MFNFLKKGKEFNKIAMILNQSYLVLTDMQSRLNVGDIKEDDRETLISTAFIIVKGVDDRIAKYDWGMDSKIIIPSISTGFINLTYGYALIMTKMNDVAQLLGITDIINEIKEKIGAYYEVERDMPSEFLNNI